MSGGAWIYLVKITLACMFATPILLTIGMIIEELIAAWNRRAE